MPQDNSRVETSLRTRFLRNFVLALIRNSYISDKETAEVEKITEQLQTAPNVSEEKMEKSFVAMFPSIKSPTMKQSHNQINATKTSALSTLLPLPSQLSRRQMPFVPTLSKSQLPKMELPSLPSLSQIPAQQIQPIKLGKITKILLDPSVVSVECKGPGKNILVNRSGQVQSASVILTKKEIDELLNEISDKTRIPIMLGLFKATFQDLVITAVVSEYVGTRFIIQKRLPFR